MHRCRGAACCWAPTHACTGPGELTPGALCAACTRWAALGGLRGRAPEQAGQRPPHTQQQTGVGQVWAQCKGSGGAFPPSCFQSALNQAYESEGEPWLQAWGWVSPPSTKHTESCLLCEAAKDGPQCLVEVPDWPALGERLPEGQCRVSVAIQWGSGQRPASEVAAAAALWCVGGGPGLKLGGAGRLIWNL